MKIASSKKLEDGRVVVFYWDDSRKKGYVDDYYNNIEFFSWNSAQQYFKRLSYSFYSEKQNI